MGPLYYPVRNWRLETHLVVIGRHTIRTLESYDWESEPHHAALDRAAARGDMKTQEGGTGISLPSTTPSDTTPDLDDQDTFVVSKQARP